MPNNETQTIQELLWKDVRKDVAQKNSILAKIIDELNPSSEYTLFKARYHFGSEILKNGHLYIPDNKGSLIHLNDSSTPANIRNKINYNLGSNPVFILLNRLAEFFIVMENHTIPLYGLIEPGKMFGTWRVLNLMGSHNPIFIWNMTAGSRSIFMLPKISETMRFGKLTRAFGLKAEKPNSLLDHWEIFREIANHPDFGETWTTEILFFSKKWFDRLDDKKWSDFALYLYRNAWLGSEFFRNKYLWDLVFSLILNERNIKPNPYISDTVKHLMAIGTGAFPGFASALNDEAAPIHRLQECIESIYQLEEYAPIIMHPHFLKKEISRPIYYSLQYPTTTEFSPKSRKGSTKIFDLYQIKSLLAKYLVDIHLDELNLGDTPIFDLVEKIQYDFFHTDPENYKGIRLSKEIPEEDKTFIQTPEGMNKNFPINSPFLRGCIRISSKIK
ncbi:MAG TPA: hypothetical protein VG895_00550 [Patescibacteria group bacterium]|nr:hypothetical protein [Gammaproteobacteria bacterium]HWA51532.1 hypothetical protein [Patescibacteria group bacterium]